MRSGGSSATTCIRPAATERIATIREEMQQTMEHGCGIYRERGPLLESVEQHSRIARAGAKTSGSMTTHAPSIRN